MEEQTRTIMDRDLIAGVVLGVLGAAFVAALVRAWFLGPVANAQLWWRFRRAALGEVAAEKVLKRAGYKIESTQAEHSWTIFADGEPIRIDVRADFLVSKDDALYVAEVKTGLKAPNLRTANTRRQLLEYRMAYPVAGVLLVDMEQVQIMRVDFPGEPEEEAPPPSRMPWMTFGLGLVAGVLLAWWSLPLITS